MFDHRRLAGVFGSHWSWETAYWMKQEHFNITDFINTCMIFHEDNVFTTDCISEPWIPTK